jgi:hypothetical protein
LSFAGGIEMSTGIAAYHDPRDLLRRFTPLPVMTTLQMASGRVQLETNDASLSAALCCAVTVQNASANNPSCLWKLVRDFDLKGKPGAPSIANDGNVVTVYMGPSCFLGADLEQKEILGFIGADADKRFIQKMLAPILLKLTKLILEAREEEPNGEDVFVAVRSGRHA